MYYKYFINLTTGIEGFEDFPLNFFEIGFTRIQSTHCERLLFEKLLDSLSTDFLMHLALGYTCIVVDYGARSNQSKAIRIGLEWIRYYLTRNWLKQDYSPIVNQRNVSKMFSDHTLKISKKSRNRIIFFTKFLKTNKINLIGLTKSTINDSRNEYYTSTLFKNLPI